MPRRVSFVRKSGDSMATTIGQRAELLVNLSRNSIHVHDGITPNGFETARADMDNVAGATSISSGKMTFTHVQELQALRTDLSAETATRSAETTALDADLTAEINARIAADAAETAARIAADNLRPTTTEMNTAITNARLPIGAIVMWYGTALAVPAGWAICNGANGTPNLVNAFPRGFGGANNVVPAGSGGSDDAVVVSHSHGHNLGTDSQGSHAHNVPDAGPVDNNAGGGGNARSALANRDSAGAVTDAQGAHAHNITGGIASTGVSGVGANVPRFATVHFIMRIS